MPRTRATVRETPCPGAREDAASRVAIAGARSLSRAGVLLQGWG